MVPTQYADLRRSTLFSTATRALVGGQLADGLCAVVYRIKGDLDHAAKGWVSGIIIEVRCQVAVPPEGAKRSGGFFIISFASDAEWKGS